MFINKAEPTHAMVSMDVSLADILGGNQLILTDSTLKRFARESWYREHVKPAKRFEDLDAALLEAVGAHLAELVAVFGNDNTVTIPEAVGEMKVFAKMLAKKHQKLAEQGSKDSPGRNALCNVYMQQVLMYNQAQTRVLVPQEPAMLKDIGQRVRLISQMSDPRRKSCSNTDEQIVAAGIYLALERRKEVTILTVDRDIGNILETSMRYFRGLRYHNKSIGDLLGQTPVMVCYSNTDNSLYAIERDSSPPPPVGAAVASVKRSIEYVKMPR